MNKKFSTLVAALMAAGALVMPADMFAQLRYVGGKTYKSVQALTSLPTEAEGATQQFIVFTEGNQDYVAIVKGNKLEAVPFEKAKRNQVVTIKYVASKTYTITNQNGKQVLGFHGSGSANFGTDIVEYPVTLSKTSITIGGAELAEGYGRFIKRDGTEFKVQKENGTLQAKAVPVSALETIVDNSKVYGFIAADEIISTSQNYIIWENGKALTNASEDGKATWANYVSAQNQYWTIEIVDNGNNTGVAKFKNDGKYLQDAEGNHITAVVTKTTDGWKFTTDEESAITLSAPVGGWTKVALGAVNQYGNTLSAADLASINGSSFGIQIVDANDKALETTSNPFTGNLKPVEWVGGNYTSEKVELSKTYNRWVMLQNAEGNILVVDTKDPYASADGSNSYKVTAITPSALAHALADDDATVSGRYGYRFLFTTADDFVVGKSQNVTMIQVDLGDGEFATLGALESNGKKLLAAAPGNTPNNDIKITIGKFNTIDVAKLLGTSPKFFTVTGKNTKTIYGNTYGKVLGLDQNGYINYVDTKDALVGYPETQWAITYNAEANTLTLKNREKPDASDYSTVGKVINAADLYYVGNSTNLFALGQDTIAIEPVASYKESDGFLRLDADQLRDQVYNVGASSAVYDAVGYFAENHANSHQIGMTTDKAVSTEWNIVPLMAREADALDHTTKVYPDTIAIESVLGYFKADGTYKETNKDDKNQVFLKVTAYTLQNSENKEYIGYNDSRYALGVKDNRKGYEAPQRFFAFKDNGDELYNLVEVEKVTTDGEYPYRSSVVALYNGNDKAYYSIEDLSLNPRAKMYSGDGTDNGILNNTGAYNQEENDLFVVEERDAAMYKKLAMADTISLYREADDADILFENGQFLGTATSAQFAEANPALYVDTAYVDRGNNNRWEYLLAVEAKHWEDNQDCGVEGHPKHKADTTSGRFLVSLMDSAYVYAAEHLHNNIFINEVDGEEYAKLGFVEGYHTHDTLYLKRPNGTYDKIAMDRKDASHSIAKFAFRFVDNTENAFVIETGCKDYNNGTPTSEVKPGYLKWLNGTIVVVDDIEKAEVFNMNTDETRTPTANEEISAEEATVSVVATDGAVIVKGAEGKNVVVSTILGKVVANEVLNSDNETIAAPAGIVVVSVDGESFKVAVK